MSDSPKALPETLMSIIGPWYQQYANYYQSMYAPQQQASAGNAPAGIGAPAPRKFPGDGLSHGYGQGGHVMLDGGVSYNEGGGGDTYGPQSPVAMGSVFSPYGGGGAAGNGVQDTFNMGPWFGNDANAAVARIYSGGGGGTAGFGGGGALQASDFIEPQPTTWNAKQYDPYVYSASNDPFNYEYDGGMIGNPNGYYPLLQDDGSGASVYYGEPGFSF